MKKLAGTTWGANSDILKQVYTEAVRPVVEYTSTTWDTAPKTNKSKLDRVQNMGLRIISDAMRRTPIQETEKSADLQPLKYRREYKAAVQGDKLKRLTSHPIHQNVQYGTKTCLKRKSFKHKLKDLQKENADLLEADPARCEEFTTSVWAPRKSLPEVRTEVLALAAKGTQAPELQKVLRLQMMQDRYPKSTWPMYSQMAPQRTLLGMEAVVPTSVAQMEPLPPSPSQLVTWGPTTEQNLTSWKLPQNTWLRETATSRILSCSLTPCLLFSLSWMGPLTFPPSSTQQPVCSVQQQGSAPVGASTCWHCLQPHFYTSYKEVKTLLKQKQKSAWRLKNNEYDPQKDQTNTLDSGTPTTIFHLHNVSTLSNTLQKNRKVITLSCNNASQDWSTEEMRV